MADPPSGDKPQYKVYKAGSDAPPREDAPPAGGPPPRQPPPGQQQAPGQQQPAQPQGPPPQYRTYRSRKRLRDRILPDTGLPGRRREKEPAGPRPLGPPRSRARTIKRVALGLLALIAGWILLSILL